MARQLPLTNGPFLGMHYVSDPAVTHSDRCYYALNMLPTDPASDVPGAYVRFFSYEVTDTGLAAVLQGFEPFQALGESVIAIAGQLYKTVLGAWSGTPWVTSAALAAASITLTTTQPVYMVEFNGQLIVSDGINIPFAVSTAAALTKLTNAPVFFGQPTVYYGKLAGIKATDRKTFVWSEENQPNTGYEAGGFNNAWTLTQGGPGDLYALRGTNAGLYYWRAESVGVIRGAVTPDFTAAGTHDDVSRQVGSVSTRALLVESDLWFVDQYGRPQRIVGGVLVEESPGSQIQDAFTDTGQPLGYPPASREILEARLGYDKRLQVVFCLVLDVLSRQRFFLFGAKSGRALCELTPDPSLTSPTWYMSPVIASVGFATTLGLVGRGSTGNVFLYHAPVAGGYYAASGATHQPTEWSVVTPPLGGGDGVDWHAEQLEVGLDLFGGAAGAALTLRRNDDLVVGSVASAIGSPIVVGAQATRRDYRLTAGLGRWSRWHQVKVSGNDSCAYWGVRQVKMRATPEALSPALT